MRRYWAILILAVVIAVGLGLRGWGLHRPALWQDEAESAIYALQILQVGYPNDMYLGERLYETRSYLPSDDPKYEFTSTNFYGSRFEKNKGWLPYYLMAAAFKFFGIGEWQARLPSVLVAGLTILLVYALSRLALGVPWSLVAAATYAVNFFVIHHERQARYYALETLLLGGVVYGYLQWRRTKRSMWVMFMAVALALLFHTHAPAAIFVGLWIIGHWLFFSPRPTAARSAVWGAGILVLIATVPWMVLVNYFAIFRYAGDDPLRFRPRWALLVGVAAFAAWFVRLLSRRLWPRPLTLGLGWSSEARWLGYFCIGYAALMPFLVPADSVALRLFIPLVPMLTVVCMALVWRLATSTAFWLETLTGLAIFLALSVGLFSLLYDYSRRRSAPYRSDWVPSTVAQLQEERRLDSRLIVTDYHQFVLSFYSRMPVQILYALRCSYFQTYSGPVLYVTHPNFDLPGISGPVTAVPYCDPQDSVCALRIAQLRSCLQENRTCEQVTISGTQVYDCSAPLRL